MDETILTISTNFFGTVFVRTPDNEGEIQVAIAADLPEREARQYILNAVKDALAELWGE